MKEIKTVLSIAGSDCSGGAGIQADIKTILANGCYAMTAVTALTAQNTLGVKGIVETTPEFLKLQLETIYEDIIPEAIKVGMVSSEELIKVIVDFIKEHELKNIVVDPVMISTSGSRLLKEDAMEELVNSLMPLADVVTPNIPETEFLTDMKITNSDDMIEAAIKLFDKLGGKTQVLVKGGHRINDANDLIVIDRDAIWIRGIQVKTENTHGTGCTLSSAIASYMALGYDVEHSIRKAKKYITNALEIGINLGHGSGPLNHGWNIK